MPTKPRGRHPHLRLDVTRVRTITTPGLHADGNGLYLAVAPTGTKKWVLRTVIAGKRRDIGLGSVRLVKLKKAREEAERLRALARNGGDPLALRRAERRVGLTFEQAAREVHAEREKGFRNPKHRRDWIASLEADAFPTFGSRPVGAINTSDVLRALTPIWTKKPETARRVRQRIKTVLDWAKAHGHRSGDNPAGDAITEVLPRQRASAEHHSSMPYSAVPAFLVAMHEAPAGDAVKLACEWLILTASRTNEVVGACWSEIDRDAKTWTVPAGRIKAGREHKVPLSARCIEILDAAEKLSEGKPDELLFPGRSADVPLSNMAMLMLLRRMGRDDITIHGFRSTFRTWCAEKTNAPRQVAEAALAHVIENKVEAAYQRSDLFERRRRLMNSWAQFCTTKPASVAVIG
jgi:integrase